MKSEERKMKNCLKVLGRKVLRSESLKFPFFVGTEVVETFTGGFIG